MTEDDNHFEVSGYGGEGFAGDANDEWRVEIVEFEGKNKKAGDQLHTLRSKFKLVHVNMACDLFSHKVKLPKWGFEQQEVTCMRSAVLAKSTWIIESNAYNACKWEKCALWRTGGLLSLKILADIRFYLFA